MSKQIILTLCVLTVIYPTQKAVQAAPHEDRNAIIVIPFKSTMDQFTKIKSFKIDGDTAIKQLASQVSAEKIIRALSKVEEFSILVEGLDAITLGDVYKAAFPNGILQTISEKYLRSPKLENNKSVIVKPDNLESIKSTEVASGGGSGDDDDDGKDIVSPTESEVQYDEVNEDDSHINNDEGLKEEPITDDYVYDQPVEDRFVGDREYVTKQNEEIETDDNRSSKNLDLKNHLDEQEPLRQKELSKYGAKFRSWITEFLAG